MLLTNGKEYEGGGKVIMQVKANGGSALIEAKTEDMAYQTVASITEDGFHKIDLPKGMFKVTLAGGAACGV